MIGQLGEVRSTEPSELGVEIRKHPRLHQRIVGDLDAGDEISGVERNLLRLGEVVRGVLVQGQPPDGLDRCELLGHELRRIEQVDALERLVIAVGEQLQAELPLEEGAVVDSVRHVPAVEVRVHAGRELRLFPDERMHAGDRFPVKLHKGCLASCVHEAEGMDAEAFHGSVRAWDRPVRHQPHDVVGCLGMERHEVPERVVRRLRLWNLAIGVRLDGVDDVGELDPVLDEEHRHVVADQIEVAFIGVELDREAPHVTNRVG